MYNSNFDPLEAKNAGSEEVVIKALKREIRNILGSYVGWFDPFCELIQNSLDAVEKRQEENVSSYDPKINILINIKENFIAVTDNGTGFTEDQYIKFLAPNFSFKDGNTRGHKGVGATYLAYGFNYVQISTKNSMFSARGVMHDARKWLDDENPAGNPKVIPDIDVTQDSYFDEIDQGVSICIKYDSTSYPSDISWVKVDTAEGWYRLLRSKTGLGAIIENPLIHVSIKVISKSDVTTHFSKQGIAHLKIDEFPTKSRNYTDIKLKLQKLYDLKGFDAKIPSNYSNLEAVYDKWNYERLFEEISSFDETQKQLIYKYRPIVYFCYVYSVYVWEAINRKIGLRSGVTAMSGGVQIAANNMPQGELIQIPLSKNIGRQKQAYVIVHFDNCSSDLGRKGFQKDITDLAKDIASKIITGPLSKYTKCFKRNSGASPDLMREQELAEWKNIMAEHEEKDPLLLTNKNFFIPIKQISMTSTPTREQDVIALFNQLIAGGVIRGIRIMSTNERFTYDGLFRVVIAEPSENHIYHQENNPLGITQQSVEEILSSKPDGFYSEPKVLEYKFSLDGLIEDIENGSKNSNDISLVVAWCAGELYKGSFYIESYLIDDNYSYRQYHGVTHRLLDISTQEPVADLILLEDLIKYLNDSEECAQIQKKYED